MVYHTNGKLFTIVNAGDNYFYRPERYSLLRRQEILKGGNKNIDDLYYFFLAYLKIFILFYYLD